MRPIVPYVGQTSRSLNIRFREHIRYIRNNNPQSAYALHILQNQHEYGQINSIMTLVKPLNNPSLLTPMNNIIFKPSTEKANLFRNKAQETRTHYFRWPLALSPHIPHKQNSSASTCKTDTSKNHPLQNPTHNDHRYVLYNLKPTHKVHQK